VSGSFSARDTKYSGQNTISVIFPAWFLLMDLMGILLNMSRIVKYAKITDRRVLFATLVLLVSRFVSLFPPGLVIARRAFDIFGKGYPDDFMVLSRFDLFH